MTDSNPSKNNMIRYKLIAINRGDELVIEIIDQKLFMVRTAREVLKNPNLINGFSLEHAVMIGVVARIEITK